MLASLPLVKSLEVDPYGNSPLLISTSSLSASLEYRMVSRGLMGPPMAAPIAHLRQNVPMVLVSTPAIVTTLPPPQAGFQEPSESMGSVASQAATKTSLTHAIEGCGGPTWPKMKTPTQVASEKVEKKRLQKWKKLEGKKKKVEK